MATPARVALWCILLVGHFFSKNFLGPCAAKDLERSTTASNKDNKGPGTNKSWNGSPMHLLAGAGTMQPRSWWPPARYPWPPLLCSTPGVTIATIVPSTILLQHFYNVFYSKTLIQVDFKFKVELLWIFIIKAFATCKGTLIFLIQVSQSKLSVLKIMSRKDFWKFMGFSFEGVNPFKIQTRIKLDFAPIFYNSKSIEIWELGQKGSLFALNWSTIMPSFVISERQEG
jgi:hypothetical protein